MYFVKLVDSIALSAWQDVKLSTIYVSLLIVHHRLCKRYIWALIKLPHIAIVARSAFSWTHFYGRAPFLFESRVMKQCKYLRG